jgi:2-polyprenyl-3-methyl-5-hydroxy-6-metoxy-1,4-benzoquinol methylase
MSAARKTNIGFNAAQYDSWFETPLGRLCGTLETGLILKLAELKPRELVIDLGCGTGFFTMELARRGARIVGVDSSAEMLEAAEEKAAMEKLPISFHQAQADSLPFTSQSFDLVVGVTVLCFAEQPDLILREANRLLKDSGRIVVGELNRLSYWSRLRKAKALFHETSYRDVNFLSPSELKQLLWQAGFTVGGNETRIFFPPINWSPVLKQYSLFERTGGVLFPSRGAFVGMKASKQLLC